MTLSSKINGLKAVWKFDNRLALVANKLLSPSEQLHVYRYRDIEFLNDHSAGDANGARDVLFSEMYRRLLAKMDLPENPTVLDLGANNGGFPLLLKAAGINPKFVICVELNPATSSRLRFNLERNFGKCAIAVNAAVCGDNRTIEVSLGSGSTSDNIYEAEGQGSRGVTHRLPGRTFDSIYEEHLAGATIDICKIDIEGAEFEAFNGLTDTRISACRYIVIEIHPVKGKEPQTLIKRLDDAGFNLIDGPSDENVYLFANSQN